MNCFEKILDVAAINGDVDGLRKLMHESGKLSAIFGAPLEKEDAEASEIIENIVRVYQLYKRQKKYGLAKAFLSLLSPTMTYSKLISLVSTRTPVSVGDFVAVSSDGHTKVEGKVEVVNAVAQTCDIHIHVRSEESKDKRWITYGQEAKEIVNEMKPELKSMFNIPLAKVTVLGDVRCTIYEAKTAQKHALSNCAGWYSTEQGKCHVRIRKSLEYDEALADHFTNETLFSVDQTSKWYGARRQMVFSRAFSRRVFNEVCLQLGLGKGARKETYNGYLKEGGYKKQVPENCVCVHCRTLGNETFDELDATILMIMLPEEFVKEFIKRSKRLRQYSCATYARELKEQHSDPHFCMKYALTTANNEYFKDSCTHFREGEDCVRPSESTMDDLANKPVKEGGRGQNATDDCWDSMCSGCDKSGLRSVMCNNCAVVMCINCVQRTRDDISTSISGQPASPVGENSTKCPTGWRCHDCQEEESLCRHRCENGQVAETYNLTAELSNAAEVHGIKADHLRDLPDLGSVDTPNKSNEENALDGLRARLRHIVRNLELLRAHKVRTVKLRTVRKNILDDLDFETVLEWKDYMGKLDARKSKQGTSENLGRKISLHGSLFIMQNPPQHIRDAHEHIDFTKFPSAEKRCLLQVNMYGASDESRQSAFHMGSVMSVQYKALKEAFPWLSCAIPYSDQCGDYRSTASTIFNHEMGRLTGIRVKFALHSEVGEGKGEVDMRFGQKSQQMERLLAQQDRLWAGDLYNQMEQCSGPGDVNLRIELDMSLFKPGASKAVPFLEQCACVEFLPEGGLILREVYGYGPGIKVTKAELHKSDHYGVMEVEAMGSSVAQASGDQWIPQQRENRDVRGQSNSALARSATKARKEAERAEFMAAEMPAPVAKTCEACSGLYQRDDTFLRHLSNGACEGRQNRAQEAKSKRADRKPVSEVLKERLARLRAEERHAALVGQINVREFEFKSVDEVKAMTVSDDAAGVFEVTKVLHEWKRLATCVLPGYTICAIHDQDAPVAMADMTAEAFACLMEQCSATRPITVSFAKPRAPMPMPGFARKRPCKATHIKKTDTQVNFLTSFCVSHETRYSEPRSKHLWQAMRDKFGELTLDPVTQRPILMSETEIFNWLKARYAAKKTAAVDIAAAQAARPGRVPKAPSKAAAKAAKPPANAQKKARQKAKAAMLEDESSDESSESSDDSRDSSSDDSSDEGPTMAAGKAPRKAVAKAPRKAAAKAPKKPSKPPVKARKAAKRGKAAESDESSESSESDRSSGDESA